MDKQTLEIALDKFSSKLEVAIRSDEYTINDLSNNKIDECLKNQLSLELSWSKLSYEISILFNEAQLQCETKFAEAFKLKHGDNYADLSSSEAKYYASTDKDYVDAKRLENKAYGLKKRVDGIKDTIESRKFVLKDLASLIIAGAEDVML